jgi:hypothetical protein
MKWNLGKFYYTPFAIHDVTSSENNTAALKKSKKTV